MSKNKGFTLIELVVVIMILGILAAVAAPKLLDTSGTATDNGVKQSLAVVRDAIERFAAENGGQLPGADGTEATLKADLVDYLRGTFPSCPVAVSGATANGVEMTTGAGINASASPTMGWKYSSDEGEFIINNGGNSVSDPAVKYEDF
jgi:prepilin-type N-terminal cleavage/methylation domain-containing protein